MNLQKMMMMTKKKMNNLLTEEKFTHTVSTAPGIFAGYSGATAKTDDVHSFKYKDGSEVRITKHNFNDTDSKHGNFFSSDVYHKGTHVLGTYWKPFVGNDGKGELSDKVGNDLPVKELKGLGINRQKHLKYMERQMKHLKDVAGPVYHDDLKDNIIDLNFFKKENYGKKYHGNGNYMEENNKENIISKLVEIYAPNTPDEHKFINMHIVQKQDYVPGYPKMNDVYTAKSVTTYVRSKGEGTERNHKVPGESFSKAGQTVNTKYNTDHGYMPGEDANVYFPSNSKKVYEDRDKEWLSRGKIDDGEHKGSYLKLGRRYFYHAKDSSGKSQGGSFKVGKNNTTNRQNTLYQHLYGKHGQHPAYSRVRNMAEDKDSLLAFAQTQGKPGLYKTKPVDQYDKKFNVHFPKTKDGDVEYKKVRARVHNAIKSVYEDYEPGQKNGARPKKDFPDNLPPEKRRVNKNQNGKNPPKEKLDEMPLNSNSGWTYTHPPEEMRKGNALANPFDVGKHGGKERASTALARLAAAQNAAKAAAPRYVVAKDSKGKVLRDNNGNKIYTQLKEIISKGFVDKINDLGKKHNLGFEDTGSMQGMGLIFASHNSDPNHFHSITWKTSMFSHKTTYHLNANEADYNKFDGNSRPQYHSANEDDFFKNADELIGNYKNKHNL